MLDNLNENLMVYLREPSIFVFLIAFLGGLLTSFTPCVYPVIPVTVAVVGMRSSGSALSGFLHAVVYVTGMAVTYTILGAAAALSGALLGQWQTNPWVYFGMANLCIFMGLACLGLFQFSFSVAPSVVNGTIKNGGLGGTLLVGAASGLVVGPCTAPVLAVIMGYVALSGNFFYGTSLLFIFAFGMGSLLIVLGAFTAFISRLPKSGNWLNKVNRIFGFILLGAGQYFLIMTGKLL